jgi:hypothetical protein
VGYEPFDGQIKKADSLQLTQETSEQAGFPEMGLDLFILKINVT